jgi:uncharacterized membrane protein
MPSRDREYWNCAPEEATEKVLAALRGAGGTVMRSPFDETKEGALQAALAGVRALSVKTAG